ncbi:hypothetical protein BH23PLA1_BH23PLA1_42540 [soil metagenome]
MRESICPACGARDDGTLVQCPRCGRAACAGCRWHRQGEAGCPRCRGRGHRLFALAFAAWALGLVAVATVIVVASLQVLAGG